MLEPGRAFWYKLRVGRLHGVGATRREGSLETDRPPQREEAAYRRLQTEADRIASLIVASDYPAIDVVIAIRGLKGFIEAESPGKTELFEMVYEGRFKRLWAQFREQRDGPLPEW